MDFYHLLFYFIIYAVIGWCVEVIYNALSTGRFVNCGMLKGAYCPIYGFGVVLIVVCLTPIADNVFLLFIGSVLLTTLLEFATGVILERIFSQKWWDYKGEFLNIKGYVCLKFSLLWGIAALLIMRVFHPLIMVLVDWMSFPFGVVLLSALYALVLVDLIYTIVRLLKIKKELKLLNELAERIEDFSDKFGGGLSDTAIKTAEGLSNVKERADLSLIAAHERSVARRDRALTELYTLRDRYEKIVGKHKTIKRLGRAFPSLRLPDSSALLARLEEIKKRISDKD